MLAAIVVAGMVPVATFAGKCGPQLTGAAAPRKPAPKAYFPRKLAPDLKTEINGISLGTLGFARAQFNSSGAPGKYLPPASSYADFHRLLDSQRLLSFTSPSLHPNADAKNTSAALHLSNPEHSVTIANDWKQPLISPEEIRKQQGAIRELLENRDLLADVQAWHRSMSAHYMAPNPHSFAPTYYHYEGFDFDNLKIHHEHNQKAWTEERELLILRNSLHFMADAVDGIARVEPLLSQTQSTRLSQLHWLSQQLLLNNPQWKEFKAKADEATATIDKTKDLAEADFLVVQKNLKEFFSSDAYYQLCYLNEELRGLSLKSEFALQKGWKTFPVILDREKATGPYIKILNGHAPRQFDEQIEGKTTSVPNSIELGGAKNPNTIIVTGPNAQGKSTYLRMIGQLQLLAQMGLPVPAEAMTLTPMSTYFHQNPADSPSSNMSLFLKQSQELHENVMGRTNRSPFQYIILDEILPGTTPEIRTAAEKVFLQRLSESGAIVAVATHNWGTTELGNDDPSKFINYHVERFQVRPGAQSSNAEMIQGAAEALEKAGWDSALIAAFRQEAEKNIKAAQ